MFSRCRPPWRPRAFRRGVLVDESALAAFGAVSSRSISVRRQKRKHRLESLHVPVMREEVLDLWLPRERSREGGIHLIDGTVGLGGHTLAAINSTRHSGNVRVLGIDRDPVALAKARRRAREELVDDEDDAGTDIDDSDEDETDDEAEALEKSRVSFHLGSFAEISTDLLGLHSFPPRVDGILMDCGMSSFQIDSKDRGFTFRKHGALDMRFDAETKSHKIPRGLSDKKLLPKSLKAWNVCSTYSASELAAIFTKFSDEPYADEIAAAIVEWRSFDEKRGKKDPGVRTTLELRYVVEEAVSAVLKSKGIEPEEKFPPTRFYAIWRGTPLKKKLPKKSKDKVIRRYEAMKPRHADHLARVFQALRIEVNDELEHIEHFFGNGVASKCLEVGGRLVMIAFHPGEDRLIREGMDDMVSTGEFELLTPEAEGLRPTREEVKTNGRSRTARLRAVERVR